MVLTEEQQIIRYPAATLEGTFGGTAQSMVNHEAKFFNIDGTKITDESSIPSWGSETGTTKDYFNHNGNPPANDQYPAGVTPASTDRSSKLYRLNATENKTGLEFMLKVMAGDKVDIFGNSYYLNTAQINNANSTPLDYATILAGWLGAPGGGLAGKGLNTNLLGQINNGLIPASFIRGNNNESPTTVPKAYINYLFFDEQFQYVSGGFSRVGSSGQLKRHWFEDAGLQNITVPKNGYIFVYVSNESNLNVFFDNVQVIHKPGALLEETHYYPFGLTMAGISSKAAGKLENKNEKFQGQPLDDDLGLNWYGFKWRNHDPQIGRFVQIDPLSEKYVYNSTYAFSENRVIDGRELEGLEWVSIKDDKGVTTSRQLTVSITNNSTLNEKQFSKLKESFKSAFSKTYGSDGAKAELIIADKSTFNVSVVDQKSTPTIDADGNEAIKFQGGVTAKLGETQENSFSVTASVDGEKRGNSDITRSFNHEAGHSAGLRHPFDPNQELTDIKQGAPGVKASTIKENLMNSDANKDNPSSTGTILLKSQFGSIDKTIQSQQNKKTN
jgi:RHS repeat-associated protein